MSKLCKLCKKIDKKNDLKKIIELSNNPKYICEKCFRLSNSPKNLCKPVSFEELKIYK